MSVLVIGDLGACHDGNFDQMRAAIPVAKACGLDVLKFQWTSDPGQMAQRRGRAAADGYAAIYRRYLAWPAEWHALLAAQCQAAGLEYCCTVFLKTDIPVIAPFVRRFKVASFEALDAEFLAAHAPYGKPVVLSTGMLDDRRVRTLAKEAARALKQAPKLLHCVSAYPAGLEALQLGVLWDEWDDSGARVFKGFSDHSAPALTMTGSWAVAAGAQIVEAHLKLDTTDPANPDAPHAMTPAQFTDYVRLIRLAEVALGSGEKRLQPCEAAMSRYRVGGSHE